jgi:penicillin-binding protein 2
MFERRLKIILWTLLVITAGLIARAGQIQLVQRKYWSDEADDLLAKHKLIETSRGSILDRKGRVLAEDQPCMDACVEYPAITEDWSNNAKWLHAKAVANAERRSGQFFVKASVTDQKRMVGEEADRIRAQVHGMWQTFSTLGAVPMEQLDDLRAGIIRRVEARRQFVMVQNYRKALARRNAIKPSWYDRWWPVASSSDDQPIDDTVEVAEESEAHVILPAINSDAYAALSRQSEDMPGLVLRPGRQRVYPYNDAACHVIGTLALAGSKPDPEPRNELRKYWPNDLTGSSGVEELCESVLRGTRGENTRTTPDGPWQTLAEAKPGGNVSLSIDIELEKECQEALAEPVRFLVKKRIDKVDIDIEQDRKNQPGAVVVLDLATNKALALVSYPTYDLNTFKQQYAVLRQDEINDPLLDRALRSAWEPGSAVKPLMAMGALSDGTITPETTYKCDGYFYIDGHQMTTGRCWTMSEFGMKHTEVPSSDPMPTEQMTVVDAIERSCNVFFETVADHMRMPRQRYWYERFGLGRPTGIGLPESAGRIPDPAHVPEYKRREEAWLAGIGQDLVAATPIQMANAAATIARGGIWMQPKLIDDGSPQATDDLNFSAENLAAVREGMEAVVDKRGGTGNLFAPSAEVARIRIAAKTGTPQASRLTFPVLDEHGTVHHQLVDPNDPAVKDWYISDDPAQTHYAHNWYIGFAPADHPKIAFAIFAEYGGSGSPTASAIAAKVLAACIKEGYLK